MNVLSLKRLCVAAVVFAAGRISHLADSEKNIWDGREIAKSRHVPTACGPCRFVESCAGGCASRRALRNKLDEPDEYCPVVRGGEEEVGRIQEMLRHTLSDPEDVPKAGNACTTVIKAGERPPA